MSPVQFYARRDHGFGGSLSKLERIKSLEPPMMEPFDETEEDENVFLGKAWKMCILMHLCLSTAVLIIVTEVHLK